MTRAMLAFLGAAMLAGCGWGGDPEPVLAYQQHYSRQEIPQPLTDPVPEPPVPPAPVRESGATERDAALVSALELCNSQKARIRDLVDNPPSIPSEDQKAK